MKKTLTDAGITLFWIVFAFLYVAGCYHSEKKHKNADTDILRYSPYSVYRGLEWIFWHDDYAGVDWEQKLNDDAFVLFQMMTTPLSTEVPEKVNADINAFKKRVSDYPKDKYLYLDSAANVYYQYITSMQNEINIYLDSLAEGRYRFEDKDWNDKSSKLEKIITDKYGIVEVEGATKQVDSTMKEIKMKVAFGDVKEIAENRKNMEERTAVIIYWMKRVYKQIFKGELKN